MANEKDKPAKSRKASAKTKVKSTSTPKTGGTPKLKLRKGSGFPIVGIGASAGGLEALEELLKNVHSTSGMAFIIVQHLDPSHVSLMPELLGRKTPIPIHQIEDGMKVRPDNIYIIPQNKNMGIFNGTLQLSDPGKQQGIRLPIDFFFRTLASDQGPNAVGIILSGTGADGTLGLRAIKAEDGLIIVQDPETARYDGMPRNAIATNLVDIIAAPSEIPAKLATLAPGKEMKYFEAADEDTAPLQQIFSILRRLTMHDFSQYKEATIQRRLERRMSINKSASIADYAHLLQDNPQEVHALFKDILISVTSFFRDVEAFSSLKTFLLKLLKTRKNNEPIRAWVPGCSSGEEAYSIAIIICECLDELGMDNAIQVFGTDVDGDAIDTARTGTYPAGITADVFPERLRKYFNRSDSNYTVKKDIRESVVFAVQDITKDPPFSKVDVVCCRNLLIYLNTELQKMLLPLMHYALNPGGILFLGPSETIGALISHFTALDKKWKIYQRIELPNGMQGVKFPPVSFRDREYVKERKPEGVEPPAVSIPDYVRRFLLSGYTPACIVIDENQNILYIHGDTNKYLQLPQGPMTTNVSEMGREGIKNELASAVRKVMSTNTDVKYEHLRVKQNGGFAFVDLVATRLTPPHESRKLFLVLFQDVVTMGKQKPGGRARGAKSKGESGEAELERELKFTQENLQTTVEELETSNEELKSANEELQSTNEELQSTNEELETSREELQSVNEELLTVNAEHQTKIEELSKANDDIKNLLEATKIAAMLLDNSLCIRRFTSGVAESFNIIPSDVGRPLSHVTSEIKYDNLVADVEQVLDTLIPKEVEVQTHDGLWYNLRIMPYRTTENVIAGIVITLVNIDNVKKLAEEKAARELAEAVVQTVREPLLVLDDKLHVVLANKSFYDTFKVSVKKIINQRIYDLGNKQWDIPMLRQLLEDILPKNSSFKDFEVEHDFLNIGSRRMLLNARRVRQQFGKKGLILLAIEDITDKK